MADRSILYRLRAALQGGYVAVANEVQLLGSNFVGVLNGTVDVLTALTRVDGTGIGAAIFNFTGAYSAQNSNISEWFGGRQLTRLRCTDSGTGPGVSGAVLFSLPGTTALNTAFDQLVAKGLPEVIDFVIEYTGPNDDFLSIQPRSQGTGPQITGQTSIIVRSGVAARLQVTRSSGTISDFVFISIGSIGNGGSSVADTITLINPTQAIWDASANGPLPTVGVANGNAYRVVNAPSDGSGRFNEIMQTDDWVVWNADTFTSWSAEPHQWFVIAAHDVRRITALEENFLTEISVTTPVSDRNTVIRGANYADTAGEIRMKLYTQRSDYSAADLNTTGDIDEYTDPSDGNGFLGIRLTGNFSALQSVLPTLYVYAEDGNGNFTRKLNLQDDFTFQGDFGAESDYLADSSLAYNANDTWRIYIGRVLDRYTAPNLDINESNLSQAVQDKLNRTNPSGTDESSRLSALESKVAALFPLTPYVADLDSWGDIYDPARAASAVDIVLGYSLIADYRGDATRYQSTGVSYDDSGTDVVRYSGLGENLFRTFGFKVDGPADEVLMWIVNDAELIPFIDMTSGGNYRVNNYTPATTENTRIDNELHSITALSGQTTLRAGTTDTTTFTVTDFPAGARNPSRFIQIGLDVLLNGSDTQAEHLQDITDVPVDATAQERRTFNATIPLGPIHNNRRVDITVAYEFRVSGGDLIADIQLVSAPSDVTILIDNVFVGLGYDADANVARVDSFVVLQDAAGDYTFTGENELIITFHPFEDLNFMDAVPVAVDSTGNTDQLNDTRVPIPAHHFDVVEVQDQTGLTNFEFRTFAPEHFLAHSDLASLLGNRTVQWCYGLALLRAITENAVTETIGFTEGIVLIGETNNTRVKVIIDDADTGNIKIGLQEV